MDGITQTFTRFADIPQIPSAGYEVEVSWRHLLERIEQKRVEEEINLYPDYQRGHVWTRTQQIAFVEYGLMGGEAGMVITTNCPGWGDDFRGPYELVDGLQRITAVRAFLGNELPAFGTLFKGYKDKLNLLRPRFAWRVLNLPTRKDVLRLYLLLNAGGTPHAPDEIARVAALLAKK